MGNSSTKESRSQSRNDIYARPVDQESSTTDANDARPQAQASRSSRGRHGSFLGIVGGSGTPDSDVRRETKQERDARKAKKEQTLRLRERERSLREEGVDGGYLVTLGTYIGPEDFSKATVRQLMLERRLAPFWRGLNDHSDSWTEHQLVAASRGLPIPAPDEIPPELLSPTTSAAQQSTATKPIAIQASSLGRPPVSTTSPSNDGTPSNAGTMTPSARGRSKTLASLSSKNDSQVDLTPEEIRLPHEPQINGQPVGAYLYKDILECPICFLYYPPYLNRTRCCDQPICSECFVQIKRPDPHPPEHLDPNSPVPEDILRLEQEGQLVSEPACCPFCVQSEFGITYEAPPFRRGLAYAGVPSSKSTSVYSSSPTPYSNGTPLAGRRRGQSVSATAPGVITTDRVRPDWASKLSEARALAARRSAAASALHAAAYTMDGSQGRLGFGRRRRFIVDGQSEESIYRADGVPISNLELLMAALGDPGSSRGRRPSGGEPMSRFASRADRATDLEELMMMEAIRQSLAAEEERKKKDEKKAKKEEKQKAKDQAKEQKAVDKASKKGRLYPPSNNTSSMLTAETSTSVADSFQEDGKGKGKASTNEGDSNAAMLGFNPLTEPTSTLNTEGTGSSRAPNSSDYGKSAFDPNHRHSPGASSSGSSFDGSRSSSLEEAPGETSNLPPVTQFSSLAEMIDDAGGSQIPAGSKQDRDASGVQNKASGEVEYTEMATPTQENQGPIIEGRFDGKYYGNLTTAHGVSNGQITQ